MLEQCRKYLDAYSNYEIARRNMSQKLEDLEHEEDQLKKIMKKEKISSLLPEFARWYTQKN